MCHSSCVRFAQSGISREEILNKKVVEVGSLNINGSLRELIFAFKPASYLGVDIISGPGVDEICDVVTLVKRFGKDYFDVVVCTEVMEHVRDWRSAVSNLKNILKPGGILLLTTRSRGFNFHAYPFDFWRFDTDDMDKIFNDLIIEANESDPETPGVLLKARKPFVFTERNLSGCELYSIISRKRTRSISDWHIIIFKISLYSRQFVAKIMPEKIKTKIKKLVLNR